MDTRSFRLAITHGIVTELGDVGKTKMQKLLYFLQSACGVPTRYRFKMHHYGPYAEALETDISRLAHSGYLDIQPDMMGFGFHIKPGANVPDHDSTAISGPHRQSIDQIIDLFGQLQTSELELAATIHFVKTLSPRWSKNQVIVATKRLKPKFSEPYILHWYEWLEQRRLF